MAAPGSDDAAVSLNDTLADVLDKMRLYIVADIPVLDEGGPIISDISLSEVLSYALQGRADADSPPPCPTGR
ncbi:MAG: hypothetical protein GX605_05405 [Chloroflexi bacterium]|nr:hypothetical protein [Chloroflexota bacterium]